MKAQRREALCVAVCLRQTAATASPPPQASAQDVGLASSVKYVTFPTKVDGNSSSYGSSYYGRLEWDSPGPYVDDMLCLLNAADPNQPPTCRGSSGGKKNNYWLAPMIQAGSDLGDKPILGMVYAHKECDKPCGDAAAKCRLCVVALANRASNGAYLPIDTTAGNNWVKIDGVNGNAADPTGTNGGTFAFLKDSAGNLAGFEACTSPDLRNAAGDFAVPAGAAAVKFDTHLHVTWAGAFQTARLRRSVQGDGGGLIFSFDGCRSPACLDSSVSLAAKEENFNKCFSPTADYTVTVTASGANVKDLAPPRGCTLANDGRDAVTGSGPLKYSCVGIPRGATTGLAFLSTASSEPACLRTTTSTIPIAVDPLEVLNLTASATSDKICPSAPGRLIYSLASAAGLTPERVAMAEATVKSSGAAGGTACTPSGSGKSWTVACEGLAVATYQLDVSVANVQYPQCPHTATVPGSAIEEYQKPVVTVPQAPAGQKICPGTKARFSFGVTADLSTSLVTNDSSLCTAAAGAAGYTVECPFVSQGSAIGLSALYGDAAAGDNCVTDVTAVALPVAVDDVIVVTGVAPRSDLVCPADGAKGQVVFGVTTNVPAASITGTLLSADGGDAVAGVTCSAPGANQTAWTVTCTNGPAGAYVLGVVATSQIGCQYSTAADKAKVATVALYTKPTIALPQAPMEQMICPGTTTKFVFDVAAANSSSLLLNNTALCGVTGDAAAGYTVTCGPTATAAGVAITAKFGDAAAGDDCATEPVAVALPVTTDVALTLTSVTPTGGSVCPVAGTTGTVSFAVSLSSVASSITPTLVSSATGAAVAGTTCSAPGSTKSSWTVTCSGAPPGSYSLNVTAASIRGCQYAVSTGSANAAAVTQYAYNVTVGGDASGADVTTPPVCSGQTTSQDVVVALSADMVGAALTVTPAFCVLNVTQSGIVYTCSGLAAGSTTTVTVTAVKNGCSSSDSAVITVPSKTCAPSGGSTPTNGTASSNASSNGYSCFSRTIGYWSTHGEEMAPWLTKMAAKPETTLALWGMKLTGAAMTTSNTKPLTCSAGSPDALRLLCVPGQKVCGEAQLARQCIAARVNQFVSEGCGSKSACFGAGSSWSWVPARIAQCCGATLASKPAASMQSTCINDMSNWNQDKSNVAPACLPGGGKGETQQVCNTYSDEFKNAPSITSCARGVCVGVARHRRSLLGEF